MKKLFLSVILLIAVNVYASNDAKFPPVYGEPTEWIAKNVRYPAQAEASHVEGKVECVAVIGKNGRVVEVIIKSSPDSRLSAEAVRVIKNMPAWIPAENNGCRVLSRVSLTIEFIIR